MSETATLRKIRTILAGWYRPRQAKLWWASSQPMFDGAVPAEMLRQGRATEILSRLKEFDRGI